MSYWRKAALTLWRNPVAMGSLAFIAVVAAFALVAPAVSPYRYDQTDLLSPNQPPSPAHLFGTDNLGRDLWTRIWVGGRVSLLVGLLGAIVPSALGVVVGGISGYLGGRVDMVIMRLIDVGLCIPQLVYVILLMIYLGSGPLAIVAALALTAWMGPARTVRGLILSLREQEFVLAARAIGASAARTIFVHLIPNTLGIVVVGVTMMIPAAIFAEAYLSFIGLGVRPPMTSWGQLANAGVQTFRLYPLQFFIPAVFISATVLAFNLVGDGLRDALDPRMRNR